MKDPRMTKWAQTITGYSLKLKKGEKILIETNGDRAEPLVLALLEEIKAIGAYPYVRINHEKIKRSLFLNDDEEAIRFLGQVDAVNMANMDAYIGIRALGNLNEMGDLSPRNQQNMMLHYMQKVHKDIRVPHTRWIVMRYPTEALAQMAEMSLEGFEEFTFQVCNLDYSIMSKAMDPLAALMERTDRVHIKGEGTDLSFSIKDIPVVKCDGGRNLPDGEVYTAPVKDSVNGVLSYNTPSLLDGTTFDNIRFEFKDGKIIKATSNFTEKMNAILDVDEGGRYVGEFALGVNPYINKPMKETLYDEKIAGSFHFTPGSCYKEAPNGNPSSLHWDLVCIQTPEYGGGEIWFDDVLIRKDGRFVLPELEGLNPENLID